jgi:hypothetical protein
VADQIVRESAIDALIRCRPASHPCRASSISSASRDLDSSRRMELLGSAT